MTKSQWRYLTVLLWVLALALAGWALWQLPLRDIGDGISRLRWRDWLLWVSINVVILNLAVKRWQILGWALSAPLWLSDLFRLRQAGSAVSFITPGPHFGGEPLQLYWLKQRFDVPLHKAVAMLGMDRFVEMGTNFAVLLAGVLMLLGTSLLQAGDWLQISLILVLMLSGMFLCAAVIIRHPQWLADRFRPLAQRWRQARNGDDPNPPEHKKAQSEGEQDQTMSGGWSAMVSLLRNALKEQRLKLWVALLMSLLGWAMLLLELFVLLRMLGIQPEIQDLIMIMVGMRLAMLLPVPGGIGTIEASLLWSFSLLGLPVAAAGMLIALIRLRDAVVLIIGLLCLGSLGGRRQAKA